MITGPEVISHFFSLSEIRTSEYEGKTLAFSRLLHSVQCLKLTTNKTSLTHHPLVVIILYTIHIYKKQNTEILNGAVVINCL